MNSITMAWIVLAALLTDGVGLTSYSAQGPNDMSRAFSIRCDQTHYALSLGEGVPSVGVRLLKFDRTPVEPSQKLKDKLAAFVGEFNDLAHVRAFCGNKRNDFDADFLLLHISGHHRTDHRNARQKCEQQQGDF